MEPKGKQREIEVAKIEVPGQSESQAKEIREQAEKDRKQAESLKRRRSDAETSGDTNTASTTTSTPEVRPNKDAETSGADGGLGEVRVAAEEVQGEGVPVTAGGDLDLRPRSDRADEQRQELIIPDDENLYPVIRTVNDPADNADNASYQDAEQQRIMEARRQQSFADRDTPVTERELRRRMNENAE